MSKKTKAILIIVVMATIASIILWAIYGEKFIIALFVALFIVGLFFALNRRRHYGYGADFDDDDDFDSGDKHIYIHRKRICPNCEGEGRVYSSLYLAKLKCAKCNGKGYIWD